MGSEDTLKEVMEAVPSLAAIISEARKYDANVILPEALRLYSEALTDVYTNSKTKDLNTYLTIKYARELEAILLTHNAAFTGNLIQNN